MLSVIDIYKKIAARNADKPAINSEREGVTYRQLDGMSNRVANCLHQHGLTTGARVAIILERSVNMISALLGVMKIGGTYIIVDPKYPGKRIEHMLKDSAASHLLTDNFLLKKLPAFSGSVLLMENALQASGDTPAQQMTPYDSLIYVIYTSGSTGLPKGVMVEHQGVANMALTYIERFGVTPEDRLLQFASMSFAASVIEVFVALLSGASLHIVPDTIKMNYSLFEDYLCRHEITLALLPPHYASELNPENNELRILITAGSPTNWEILEKWLPHVTYYNVYGCSETSTGVSAYCANRQQKRTQHVPIGDANNNTKFYIVDENGGRAAIGVAGELCIAGVCIARGYLNKPELTADRFISISNERAYRTGDLARANGSGDIEIIGRMDDQVKINGHRIELGEINHVIRSLTGVKDSVVLPIKIRDSYQLCAYCLAPSFSSIQSIKNHLLMHLPEYMVPAFILQIDSIPLNINGKVDRFALPHPDEINKNRDVISSRNDHERQLVGLWSSVLKIEDAKLSIFDNYFSLGGDSITAIQLVSELYKSGYRIEVQDIFDRPSIAQLANLLERSGKVARNLIAHSAPLVDKHLQEFILGRVNACLAKKNISLENPVHVTGGYRLSPMQNSLYLSYIKKRDSKYIVHNEYVLQGNLNLQRIRDCVAIIVARHDILRTVFTHHEVEYPLQLILSELPLRFDVISLGMAEREESRVAEWIEQDRQQSFDLEAENAIRFYLLEWSGQQHSLIICYHHIIMDGWCQNIFWSEFQQIYYSGGDPAAALREPIPYYHYIEWLANLDSRKSADYWKSYLADFQNPLTTTSADFPDASLDYHSATFHIGPATTQALVNLCKQEQLTVSCLLKCLWGLVLQEAVNSWDVVFGEVVAGRPPHLQGAEQIMGLFVNTLPVRITRQANQTVSQLARSVQRQTTESQKHQFLSLAEIQSLSSAKNHLVDHIFVYENFPGISHHSAPSDIHFAVERGYELDEVNYDLNVSVSVDATIRTRILYRSPAYQARRIDSLYQRFAGLIEVAAQGLNVEAGTLFKRQTSLIQAVLEGAAVELPVLPLHRLLEKNANAGVTTSKISMPVAGNEAIASPLFGYELDYPTLNRRANQVAHYLLSKGIKPGELVAIYLDRSTDYIVSLLGVLKSGAAYLPLDKTYEGSRVQAILQTAAPGYLIYRSNASPRLSSLTMIQVDLDEAAVTICSQSEKNPELNTVPELAQVLFTSGTTGTPRGVQISHKNLLNHALFVKDKLKLSAADAVLQFACLGFDAFSEEIFPALLAGASIVLRPANLLESYDHLTEIIGRHNISLLDLPTSYWNHWVDALVEGAPADTALKNLRNIILGGESISPKHVNLWQRYFPGIAIINSYGPTETTVICSWHEVPPVRHESDKISIGLPINNTRFYILNQDMQPVAAGESGELFVGGAGVSKGYLHLPDVTAQRFLNGAIFGDDVTRVYRTGDLVYVDPTDAKLHFIGRADEQIKIRGYQVDLGDIKRLVDTHVSVRQCQVIFSGRDGSKKLRVYVQPSRNTDINALRSELHALMPSQVVPDEFIFVEKWPLNSNGKTDAGALASLAIEKEIVNTLKVTDKTQQIMLDIWQEVLGQQVTDLDANFFELGGHSLQAISLLTKIKRQTDVKLSVDILFNFPSIRSLADQVSKKANIVVRSDRIVLLTNEHQASTKGKMFFFPPVGGGIVCYKYLAGLIESRYIVYGLQNTPTDQNQFMPIREMAKKYLADITAIQSKGPYSLGGWSMGGVLAQEVACLLEARGEQVDLLALIDTWHPRALPESEISTEDLDYRFAVDFIRSTHEHAASVFDDSLLHGCDIRTIWQTLVANGILPEDFEFDIFYNYYSTYKNNQQALLQHVPEFYPASAILFQAKHSWQSIPDPPHKLGWKECIRNIDTVLTDADHYGLLKGEAARIIAEQIAVSPERVNALEAAGLIQLESKRA